MTKPEQIPIVRHMSKEELDRHIKTLEKSTRVLQRLYFIKYRYAGESVEESANRVSITKNNAYIWQKRWNEEGYNGLIPKFAGGKPSKLTDKQKDELKQLIAKKDNWTTEGVRELIFKKFGVEYTSKQIRIILKKMKMNHAKPYQYDYRRPDDADELLKKPPKNK